MGFVRRGLVGAAALAVLGLVFVVAPNADAATTGTLVITSNRTLTQDHNGNVLIAADDVTFDCANHTVSGPTTTQTGIDLSNHANVIVRNCKVTGFVHGLLLVNANNSTLSNNTVTGGAGDACVFSGAAFNFVSGNSFNANGGGCLLENSGENTFDGNVLWNNVDEGFDLNSSDDNSFTFNDVEGNRDGFDLDDSHFNVIQRNAVMFNNLNGIELDFSNNNDIEFNSTLFNGRFTTHNGISFDSANDNTVRQNHSDNNGRNGFRIQTSSGNWFDGNEACNNNEIDALQDRPQNTWTGNSFCTKSPNIP